MLRRPRVTNNVLQIHKQVMMTMCQKTISFATILQLFPITDSLFNVLEAISPAAFIHGADLWHHPFSYAGATAEQQLQLHQQAALLHPALQQQLPVRSFL